MNKPTVLFGMEKFANLLGPAVYLMRGSGTGIAAPGGSEYEREMKKTVMGMWGDVLSKHREVGGFDNSKKLIVLASTNDKGRIARTIESLNGGKNVGAANTETTEGDDLSRAIRQYEEMKSRKIDGSANVGQLMRQIRKPGVGSSAAVDKINLDSFHELTPTEGHELGHRLTSIDNGKKIQEAGGAIAAQPYTGNRPIFGVGKIDEFALRSEADATNEFLKRLSPGAQKIYGPGLAAAYDTYAMGAGNTGRSSGSVIGKIQDILIGRGGKIKKFSHGDQVHSIEYKMPYYTERDISSRIARPDEIAEYKGIMERKRRLMPGEEMTSNEREYKALISNIQKRHAKKLKKIVPRLTEREKKRAIVEIAKVIKDSPESLPELKKMLIEDIKQTRRVFGPSAGIGTARVARQFIDEIALSTEKRKGLTSGTISDSIQRTLGRAADGLKTITLSGADNLSKLIEQPDGIVKSLASFVPRILRRR